MTPPATGTLALLINSSPDAEFDGVGVGVSVGDAVGDGVGVAVAVAVGVGIAATARVAIRKPFEILMGTTVIDLAVGPPSFFPVLALKTLLSFGHETFAALTCEASKFVASCGQLAIKPVYFEVVDRKTRIRLPAIVNTLAAPTLSCEALPRLMSLAWAARPVSRTVARAREPPISSRRLIAFTLRLKSRLRLQPF